MSSRMLLALLGIGLAATATLLAAPIPPERTHTTVDAATVTAYKKLGAEHGTIRVVPSGLPIYEPMRRFYLKNGYDQEATASRKEVTVVCGGDVHLLAR